MINPRAEHSVGLTGSQHLADLTDERLGRERLFEEVGAFVGNGEFEGAYSVYPEMNKKRRDGTSEVGAMMSRIFWR